MRTGDPDTPNIENWLIENLSAISNPTVAQNAKFTSICK